MVVPATVVEEDYVVGEWGVSDGRYAPSDPHDAGAQHSAFVSLLVADQIIETREKSLASFGISIQSCTMVGGVGCTKVSVTHGMVMETGLARSVMSVERVMTSDHRVVFVERKVTTRSGRENVIRVTDAHVER